MSSLYAPMPRPQRPIGVTVLAILQILNGLGDIAIGAILLVLAVLAGFVVGGPTVTLLYLFDFVFIALGIFSFILAYGLWTGKGWAWMLSIIGAVIGIILGIVTMIVSYSEGYGYLSFMSIIPIILYLLTIVYLFTANVRAFFGRISGYAVMPPTAQPYVAPTSAPYPPPTAKPPPAYYPPPQPMPAPAPATVNCSNCGAPNQLGANFCDRCGTRLR
jgi:hypothetical protein